MRRVLFGIGVLFLAVNGFAQSADEIIAKYIATIGGMDRINAVTSLKRTGKFTGGGGNPRVVNTSEPSTPITNIVPICGPTDWMLTILSQRRF